MAGSVRSCRETVTGRSNFDADYFLNPNVEKSPARAKTYVALLEQRVPPSALVVDIGCATGTALKEVVSGPGWAVCGVDHSLAALRDAGSVGLPVICAIADSLPIADNSVDALLCLDVVEHLDSPYRALLELRRVVRPGGSLVVTTPNAASPMRRILGHRWHGLQDDTHLYFFTRFTLGHVLCKTGWLPQQTLTSSGAPGVTGRLLSRLRMGGELCIVATAR